jgi:hypothetical protein
MHFPARSCLTTKASKGAGVKAGGVDLDESWVFSDIKGKQYPIYQFQDVQALFSEELNLINHTGLPLHWR